jgi:hypothetical protein
LGVRPSLHRHVVNEDALAAYPSIVREVLDLCHESRLDESKFLALLEEFEIWLDMLAPPGLEGAHGWVAWNQGSNVQSTIVPLLPSGDWQTVRFEIPAPPKTELYGLLYDKPCRVWIRRSVFRYGSVETAAVIKPGPASHVVHADGLVRLAGAKEARQMRLVTPSGSGPYTLELEFLLESGPRIINETAARIADRLQKCTATRVAMERGIGNDRRGPR